MRPFLIKKYPRTKYSKVRHARISAHCPFAFIVLFRYIKGIFTGPDIRKIRAHDEMFSNALNPIELRAWNSFKDVCDNFLGKTRADDYNEKIDELIEAYGAMGCIMAPKMHLLQAHRDAFPYHDEVLQLLFFN